MTERWRCFVAVPLDDRLRSALAAAVEEWRKDGGHEGLRWTDPSSWHLTLAFMGSTDPNSVGDTRRAIESVAANRAGFVVRCGGLGAFPSNARARVLWYGIEASPDLERLVADLRGALGLDASEPFVGHVTLARTRGGEVDLRPLVSAHDAPSGTMSVGEIQLMRSHLGAGPVRHEVLATARLGVAARV